MEPSSPMDKQAVEKLGLWKYSYIYPGTQPSWSWVQGTDPKNNLRTFWKHFLMWWKLRVCDQDILRGNLQWKTFRFAWPYAFTYSASKARLEIKEDRQKGVFIQNCTEISVSSAEQMLKTMDSGSQNRKVAFTGMNERSSRSHSLFIIHLYQKNLKKDSSKQSKLYFVDLAGSEKVGKTGVVGQQLE